MKRYYCLVFFFILLMMGNAHAATFNVTNETEFQNALTTAASNGQHDVINVSAGTMILTAVLNYSPAGTENYTLVIQGTEFGSTILDGGTGCTILSLSTTGIPSDTTAHVVVVGITFQNGTGQG